MFKKRQALRDQTNADNAASIMQKVPKKRRFSDSDSEVSKKEAFQMKKASFLKTVPVIKDMHENDHLLKLPLANVDQRPKKPEEKKNNAAQSRGTYVF